MLNQKNFKSFKIFDAIVLESRQLQYNIPLLCVTIANLHYYILSKHCIEFDAQSRNLKFLLNSWCHHFPIMPDAVKHNAALCN